MRKYTLFSFIMLLSACSLPTAISLGMDDINEQYQKDQMQYRMERAKSELYSIDNDGNRAIVAFVKGNLEDAQSYATLALQANPKDPYALMVMAVINDINGITNKAGFYYQEIIDTKTANMTTLGQFKVYPPQTLYEAASNRLKVIDLHQAPFIITSEQGEPPMFNIKPKYQAASSYKMAPEQKVLKVGEDLFSEAERNIISRFMTLKALAEKGYITKDEFMARRQANIGALLPQTKAPGAKVVTAPVPPTASIIDRFDSLKRAYELKAINSREYVAERDTILEALLPVSFAEKMVQIAPPGDLLSGADDVRKLEILYSMDLITSSELQAERAEIENILKMGRSVPVSQVGTVPSADESMQPIVPATKKVPTPLKKPAAKK